MLKTDFIIIHLLLSVPCIFFTSRNDKTFSSTNKQSKIAYVHLVVFFFLVLSCSFIWNMFLYYFILFNRDQYPFHFIGKHFNKSCVCVQLLSHVWLFVTLWTIAHQASLSRGFSQQDYWSGLPFPPPGDLPNPGFQPVSPASPEQQVDSLLLSHGP